MPLVDKTTGTLNTDRLHLSIDLVPHPLIVIDADDFSILFENRAAKLVPSEAKKTCHACHHNRDIPCDETESVCPVREVKRTGKQTVVEHIHRYKDGNHRVVSVHAFPVFDENGHVVQVIEYALDITERISMEDTFRENDQRFQTLIETSPDGIGLTDLEGTITYVSSRMVELHGFNSTEELVGKSITEFIDPAYHQKIGQTIQETLKRKTTIGTEYLFLKQDGTRFIGELSLSLIRNSSANPKGFMGVLRDITERKRTEDSLKESEKRYRAVVENQTELICRFLPQGTLTFVNDAYCRHFGKSRKDLVGNKFMPLIPEEDHKKVKAHFDSISLDNPVATHDHRVIAKDGKILWLQWSNQGIFDEQGHIIEYQSVGRDITERMNIDRQLARIEKLESVGVLAGGIAHDFNNILTPILASISIAKTYGELDDEIAEVLTDAEKATLRAKDLTQQLLTLSRGGEPVREASAISNLLEDEVKFALTGSNVKCDYSVPEDLWAAEIDQGQIGQVIRNLIINADQAMPEGGTIKIGGQNVVIGQKNPMLLKEGKYIQVSIADEGIGIPEKHLSHIFDPFYTTKDRGSGLGLTTTFGIINRHQGTIQVESKMGVGTTFHIHLPASEKELVIDEKERKKPRTGQGRILLVDDEETVRRSAGKILKRLGYEIEFAEDGAEGIRLYKKAIECKQPFDIVIMDLTIPGGMGGKEASKLLKKIDPGARVIVSSGYSEGRVLSNFEDYGFCGRVTKPYGIHDLAEVIHEALIGAQGQVV